LRPLSPKEEKKLSGELEGLGLEYNPPETIHCFSTKIPDPPAWGWEFEKEEER